MRNRFWTLALAVPLAVLPATVADASSQDDPRHQESTRMVAVVLAKQAELGLTASQVKKLEQYRNQLELQTLQRQQSSKPQNTNALLVTSPEQAQGTILSIVGADKQVAVLRTISE